MANDADNTVSILRGDGRFSTVSGSPVALDKSPRGIVIDDLYSSHQLGLAVVNSCGNSVSIVPQH